MFDNIYKQFKCYLTAGSCKPSVLGGVLYVSCVSKNELAEKSWWEVVLSAVEIMQCCDIRFFIVLVALHTCLMLFHSRLLWFLHCWCCCFIQILDSHSIIELKVLLLQFLQVIKKYVDDLFRERSSTRLIASLRSSLAESWISFYETM